jgi:hypothetical protein
MEIQKIPNDFAEPNCLSNEFGTPNTKFPSPIENLGTFNSPCGPRPQKDLVKQNVEEPAAPRQAKPGVFIFEGDLQDVRLWPKADMPKHAINVAIGGKADMAPAWQNVCL